MSDPSQPYAAAWTSDRRVRVEEIFTPASPVGRRDLFAGRIQWLEQLLELMQQPGRHAVLFGEQGTGKTSLALVAPAMASAPIGLVHVAAASGDTFEALWRRVGDAVRLARRRAERGLASPAFPADAADALGPDEAVTDDAVLAFLARLGAGGRVWIVLDDFHLVTGAGARSRARALAEATAGPAPDVTLVFTGVGQSGEALLDPSSALVPVQLARMSPGESMEIVLRALRALGMGAEDSVVERIATLANGLPAVPHLLARAAARVAAHDGVATLRSEHLDAAVRAVLAGTDAGIEQAYEQAIVRARRGIYPEILLACALAARDVCGRFTVADVCRTLTRIVRREVRGLTNQVGALTEEGRGAVLEKQGAAKAATYRFVDPRLEPYILMRGLEEGWTTRGTPAWMPGSQAASVEAKAA